LADAAEEPHAGLRALVHLCTMAPVRPRLRQRFMLIFPGVRTCAPGRRGLGARADGLNELQTRTLPRPQAWPGLSPALAEPPSEARLA
jgi:hypothetical protein